MPVASRRPTVRSWRSPSTRTTSLTPTLPRTRMRGGSRRPRTSRSASARPCTRPRNGGKVGGAGAGEETAEREGPRGVALHVGPGLPEIEQPDRQPRGPLVVDAARVHALGAERRSAGARRVADDEPAGADRAGHPEAHVLV